MKNKPEWEIEVTINKYNLTAELIDIEIGRFHTTPYSIYKLIFNTDTSKRLLFDKINSNYDIKLIFKLTLNSTTPVKISEINLMYLYDESDFSMKKKDSEDNENIKDVQFSKLIIVGIPKNSIQSCLTMVDPIILFNTTPESILKTIKNNKIEFKTPIENKEIIKQYVIEKKSFIKEFEKLNHYYGLYNGTTFKVMNEFHNCWYIGNLSDVIKKDSYITCEIPTSDKFTTEMDEKVIKNFNNPKNEYYYCSPNINIKDHTNYYFSKKSYINRNVTYPFDSLFNETLYKDIINDIIKKYSPIDRDANLKVSSNLKNKFMNNYNLVGCEYNTTSFINNITEKTSELMSIELTIDRITNIENFFQYKIIQLQSKHTRYSQFCGKYILNSTTIFFTREKSKTWECRTNLKITRTNSDF